MFMQQDNEYIPHSVVKVFGPATFAVGAVLLAFRTANIRHLTEPWAEDATDLILGALRTDAHLLSPIYDCPALIQRILAALAVKASLAAAPLTLAAVSIIYSAFVAAYFTRRTFSWLVPDTRLRAAFSIILCLGPGSLEIAGNGVCIAYTHGLFLVLLALEDPFLKLRYLLPLWLLLGLSTNLSFIALPILFIRLLIAFKRETAVLFVAAATVSIVPVFMALSSGLAEQNFAVSPFEMIQGAAHYAAFLGLISPLTGLSVGMAALKGHLDLLLALLVLPVLIACLIHASRTKALTAIGLMLTGLLFFVAHNVSRPPNWNALHGDSFLVFGRHAVLLVQLPVLAWLILFTTVNSELRGKLLGAFVLVQILIFPLLFSIRWEETQPGWAVFTQKLEAANTSAPSRQSFELQVGPVVGPRSWATIQCRPGQGIKVNCQVLNGNNDPRLSRLELIIPAAD